MIKDIRSTLLFIVCLVFQTGVYAQHQFDSINRTLDKVNQETSDNSTMIKYRSIFQHPDIYSAIIPQVKQLRSSAGRMAHYLDSIKSDFKFYVDQSTSSSQDKPDDYFIIKGNAKSIQNELISYYKFLIHLIPKENIEDIKQALKDIRRRDFDKAYFTHIPDVAAVTMLNKFLIDARKNESMALDALSKKKNSGK